MAVIEVRCKKTPTRRELTGPQVGWRMAIWFWRVQGGQSQDSYDSIVMSGRL